MAEAEFHLEQFSLRQGRCALKVGTDGLVLGAWADAQGARLLDIGTGTGLLALMAAQRNPAARIDAVDIDDAAAAQAAANAAASPWADRVRVHRMDVRRIRSDAPYDRILCNPPFFDGGMAAPDARAAVARHGAELRFDELVGAVDRLLTPGGRFACIIPLDREAELLALGRAHGLFPLRRCVLHYLQGRPPKRVLLELHRRPGSVKEEVLTVAHAPGRPTAAYTALLTPFLRRP